MKNDRNLPKDCFRADADLSWKPAVQVLPRLNAFWQSWLLDPGSLTQRLVTLSQGEFRVAVHEQVWSRKRSPALLQCFQPHLVSQNMWSRTVTLYGNDQPWVAAHSLIPADSLRSPLKRICKLQEKPLGEFLFRHPLLLRCQLEVACIGDVWGRRSLFYLYGKPLLVAEFFLPDLVIASKFDEDLRNDNQ